MNNTIPFFTASAANNIKLKGTLPSSTMAVPVQYLGSSDITGLQTPAHFYRIIVPPVSSSISGHQQDLLLTKREELEKEQRANNNSSDNDENNNGEGEEHQDNNAKTKQQPSSSDQQQTQDLFDDEASPIIYILSRGAANIIARNYHHRNAVSGGITVIDDNDMNDMNHHHGHQSPNTTNNNNNNISAAATTTTGMQQNHDGTELHSLKDSLVETIEFAHVQCLLMSQGDAQKLIDEAGCVPSRIWKTVPLLALCASSDFPLASATAISGVGKVFVGSGGDSFLFNNNNNDDGENEIDEEMDEEGDDNQSMMKNRSSSSSSVVGVRVNLTRARRVIHIMNENVISGETSAASKLLRSSCAALWCALVLHASQDALEYVKPILSASAAAGRRGGGNNNNNNSSTTNQVAMAHAARLWHIKRIKKRRESLFSVDATAGAVLQTELRESKTLTQATTAIRQQLYRSIGRVTDLVGSAMRYEIDWSSVERPPFGRKLRRTHFRPFSLVSSGSSASSSSASPASSGEIMATAASSNKNRVDNHLHNQSLEEEAAQSADEPVFLWSKALPPIPVVLARQGWERCVQSDPVMWRFKSLPVRLKETTTKLSRLLSCATSDMMVVEQTQIARATVLRSLPWTPGDCLLLVDGLPSGVYTGLASFLKERHGVVIHTLGMSHPISGNDEMIVNAFSRAMNLVKPLVCIIPHITRTGHVLPIERLIPLCRERNVVVIVDGTDVLNNVADQVGTFGADFYIAPLDGHLFCPAGMTALIVSSTRKKAIDTLTVSYFFGQGFSEEWTYTGLTDQSRMMSVMQALQFTKAVCPDQRQYTKQLAAQAHEFLTKFWNVPSLYEKNEPASAVVAVLLPLSGQRHDADARFLQGLLMKRKVFVEVLALRFSRTNDFKLAVRMVFYPYNDMLEVKKLAVAMQQCISEIS